MVESGKGKGNWRDWETTKDEDVEVVDPVGSFNLADLGIQKKPGGPSSAERHARADEARERAERQRISNIRSESSEQVLKKRESSDIFDAVRKQDEDFIKGLLMREFGSVKFRNLDDLYFHLDEFFTGGEEPGLDLSDPKGPSSKVAEMDLVFRPRIGDSAQFVEFKLVDQAVGVGGSKKITRVKGLKFHEMEQPSAPSAQKEKPQGQGWFSKLFGKKE
ncbi:MAG: hypothetical protein WCT11_01220 [Candidatus Magasanikbacteria bacterium]